MSKTSGHVTTKKQIIIYRGEKGIKTLHFSHIFNKNASKSDTYSDIL